MSKPSVRELWRQTPIVIVPFLWLLAVTYNVLLGLAFLVGGPDRITGPSFAIIRSYGGHISMGTLFCVGGVLIAMSATGRAWHMAVSFGLVSVVHLFIVASFIVGTLGEPSWAQPKVAWTGIPTYFAVAATHMALARLYWYFERKADGAV